MQRWYKNYGRMPTFCATNIVEVIYRNGTRYVGYVDNITWEYSNDPEYHDLDVVYYCEFSSPEFDYVQQTWEPDDE